MIWPALGFLIMTGLAQLYTLVGKEQPASHRFADVIIITWIVVSIILLLRMR